MLTQTGAHAQSAFARDRDIGVLDRAHPEYDPLGILVGSFVVRPELDLGVNYDDNIYATDDGKISDSFWTIAPKVSISSNWDRDSLSLTASDTATYYDKQTTENSNQWTVSGTGHLDISNDADITATLNTAHSILARSSAAYTEATVNPIEYDRDEALLTGEKTFNRIRLSGVFDAVDYDYANGHTSSGAVVDESFQNRSEYDETGRVDYAVSPATAAFVSLTGTELQYASQGETQGRNATGERILAGLNFELTHLTRGEFSFGYNTETFSQQSSKIQGFSYKALVHYYPTPLLTVTLTADQIISASDVIGSVGYSAQILQIQGDYELLRNFILTGIVGRTDNTYQDLAREDDRYNFSLGGTYLLNRDLGVKFLYTVLNQDSSGAARGPDFTQQVFSLTLVLRR